MKKKIVYTILSLAFIVGLALPALAGMNSGSYLIPNSVLSGGGSPMSSGSYQSDTTLGQSSPLFDPYDPPNSTSFDLHPGFWYTLEAVILLDADNDGIPDDGDGNGTPGDNPCTGGVTNNCDDNCPDNPNSNQEDTYPPGGNGIGDACDCECDFDCDGDVDSFDVDSFLTDFGRSSYVSPCVNDNPCNGDCACDGDVDSFDMVILLEDFGRGKYVNPCPVCEMGDWCSY